jgi:hypothetical protein
MGGILSLRSPGAKTRVLGPNAENEEAKAANRASYTSSLATLQEHVLHLHDQVRGFRAELFRYHWRNGLYHSKAREDVPDLRRYVK